MSSGAKPLFRAVQQENLPEVKKLLQSKSCSVQSRDRDGQTVLHIAANLGNLGILKLLCQKKANVNAKDINGWTPLHCAADGAHLACCELLLQHKSIDATVLNNDQNGPLAYLCRQSKSKITSNIPLYVKVMDMLIEQRADVNTVSSFGESVLHMASWKGNRYSVQVLLTHGADVNALNTNKETPLHWAVRRHNKDIATVLMSYGADPFISSAAVHPMEIAIEENQQSLVEMMTARALLCGESIQECNKKGLLEMQTAKQRWKKLYFVLKADILFGYKSDEPENKPKYTYCITELEVETVQKEKEKKSRPFSFKLVEPYRVTTLAANSEIEMMDWTSSIIQGKKIQQNIDLAEKKRIMNDTKGREDVTPNKSPSDSVSSEETTAHLMSVLEMPGNDVCADCSSTEPYWFLLKYGIIVCFDCATIHQELGTSDIRSAHFGAWELAEVMKMKCNGNMKSNGIFEHLIPPEDVKPSPTHSMEQKKKFIQLKYIDEKFSHKKAGFSPVVPIEPEATPKAQLQHFITSRIIDYQSSHSLDTLLPYLPISRKRWDHLISSSPVYQQISSVLNSEGLSSGSQPVQNDTLKSQLFHSYGPISTLSCVQSLVLSCITYTTLLRQKKSSSSGDSGMSLSLPQTLRTILDSFDSLVQAWPDVDDVPLIMRWWCPQLMEATVIAEAANAEGVVITNYLKEFTLNSSYAIYLLTRDYMHRVFHPYNKELKIVTGNEEMVQKMMASLRTESKSLSESLKKLVHTSYKYAQQGSSDSPSSWGLENISFNRTTSLERFNRVNSQTWSSSEHSPRSESSIEDYQGPEDFCTDPPIKRIQNSPGVMSIMPYLNNLVKDIPPHLIQELFGILTFGQGTWISAPSSSISPSLNNIRQHYPTSYNQHDNYNFVHALILYLEARMETLRNSWPTIYKREQTTISNLEQQCVLYELHRLQHILAEIFYSPVVWTEPNIYNQWTSLKSVLTLGIEILYQLAVEKAPKERVREALDLLLVHCRWCMNKFIELETLLDV